MSTEPAATLKDQLFSPTRVKHIAKELSAVSAVFDSKRFLAETLKTLETLSLMERLRHVTERLHANLPLEYRPALAVLRKLAPRIDNGFVTLVLSDYVALFGGEDFEASMDALRFFTPFGSAEFAVRHFLRRDLARTLAVMETWSKDKNEHVRRLASEGSRPRLPWSFRIEPLMVDPSPVANVLDNLKNDPSLYVRKSVANHLNDITKDNPGWALARIRGWSLDDKHTAWIAKHALRSLIKQGDREALTIIGAGDDAAVELNGLAMTPAKVRLGEEITLSFELLSTIDKVQNLVVDYAIHYVRNEGRTSRKVFKLKTVQLAPRASVSLSRRQTIRDFSTRTHYMGRHEVEVMVNGRVFGHTEFELKKPR